MPGFDYSRFDTIGASDSEGEGPGPDLNEFLAAVGGRVGGGGGGEQESESEEEESQRAPPPPPPRGAGEAPLSSPPAPSLERFAELANGAEALSGEDVQEIVATVRVTVESATQSGDTDTLRGLVLALLAGFHHQPKPRQFVCEQGPELINELLFAVALPGDPQQHAEVDELLALMVRHCKAQELYTFLLEALCSHELDFIARERGMEMLKETLQCFKAGKQHCFLSSCLPVLLKRCLPEPLPQDFVLGRRLFALQKFAVPFMPTGPSTQGELTELGPAQVAHSLISGFLFKGALRALPAVLPVEALDLETIPAQVSGGSQVSELRRPPLDVSRLRFLLRCHDLKEDELRCLCGLFGDAAASSSRPLLTSLEELDIGDPTGDGGGDLEVSPLCLAALVSVVELHGCWQMLSPQVPPIGVAAHRRLNLLMRSSFVLLSNGEGSHAGIVDLAQSGGASSSQPAGPRWSHRGLALFASAIAPLMRLVAAQTPKAFEITSSTLCRWYPQRIFRALLEALTSTPDIEREVRSSLFRVISASMRLFAWPARAQIYLDIIKGSRTDAVMGAVVTLFKDDWWRLVQAKVSNGQSLADERNRLVDILKVCLSGDIQIVDGMDTLAGALNIARLVALAAPPAGPYLRAALVRGGVGLDLESLLAGISKQIDAELGLLERGQATSCSGLSKELAEAMQQALGKAEGSVNFEEMKRDRIMMVAHLVARVRELLSEGRE